MGLLGQLTKLVQYKNQLLYNYSFKKRGINLKRIDIHLNINPGLIFGI